MHYIAIFAFLCLHCVNSQEPTPDERRQQLVNDFWDVTSENGCFMRQTGTDMGNLVDENNDTMISQKEFQDYVSVPLGNKPANCMWGKMSAIGGNPIPIPAGTNKIFEFFKPNGDCISETNFKTQYLTWFKECRWPEDENAPKNI